MQPIDYRNATWQQLQARLTGQRRQVYQAWIAYGPGTTRAIARRAGMSILSFRPRTTELYQLGFLALVESDPSDQSDQSDPSDLPTAHEGTYTACTMDQARVNFEARRAESMDRQLLFL